MSYIFTSLCYVRFISALLAIGLAWFLWKRRNSQGAIYLMVFEVSCAIWAVGDAFGDASIDVMMKMHWAGISYIGITISAIMFLLFAFAYTNLTRLLTPKTIAILMVIPVLTNIIAFTNQYHHLLWSSLVIPEGTNLCIFYYGPWFWVNVIYEYSALTIGIFVLLIGAFKVFSNYKIQLWLLVAGTLLPFFASITYIFKVTPFKGIDPTSIAFIISGAVIAISLYWLRMFNIMPIARKQAIDNLNDGMIILDSENRVVEANPAFCKILKMTIRDIIGKQVDIVLLEIGVKICQFSSENDFNLEFSLGAESNQTSYEIKCHKLNDKNQRLIGRILTLADITTKKMILDSISDSNNRRKIEIIEKEKLILDLDAYARSVAHDLKNPICSVVGFSELAKVSLLENKRDEALEMIGVIQNQSEKIVKRIIQKLGGEVKVVSTNKPGEGCVFNFTLKEEVNV